jgi:NAD dependent epimerase/dehydratase family enzyme
MKKKCFNKWRFWIYWESFSKFISFKRIPVSTLSRTEKQNRDGILITNGCCQNDNDENAVLKADFIIHLAGENIAEKRWTAKRKAEIIDREQSTQLLYS